MNEASSRKPELIELSGNWNDIIAQDTGKVRFWARFERQAAWVTFAVAMLTLMAAVYHVI